MGCAIVRSAGTYTSQERALGGLGDDLPLGEGIIQMFLSSDGATTEDAGERDDYQHGFQLHVAVGADKCQLSGPTGSSLA